MLIDWNIPFTIGIRVLLNSCCNYACFFCHNEGEKKIRQRIVFNPKEFKKILLAFKKVGSRSAAFSGGEPLLFPLFEKYVKIAVDLFTGKNIYITTNGSLIGKKIDFFRKYRIKKIYISLHSLSPSKYKRITSVDNLEKVVENIDLLIKNKTRVVINMMVLKGINFNKSELEKMFDFCRERHIRLNLLRFFSKNGYQKHYVGCREIRKKMKKLGFLEIIPTKVDIFPFTRFKRGNLSVHLRDFGPVLKNDKFCHDCPFRKECNEGFYYPRVTPGGLLKPCLWREDLSLDLKNSLKNDTLLVDICKFFKKFSRGNQPWKRLND